MDTNQLKNNMATISPNGRFVAAAAFTADVKVIIGPIPTGFLWYLFLSHASMLWVVNVTHYIWFSKVR